jgi:disulfide bond formation protein DsbB
MLESFPLSSALPMIFRGAGDCSVVDWTFLGLSIANWSFLTFASILAALALYLLRRDKTPA